MSKTRNSNDELNETMNRFENTNLSLEAFIIDMSDILGQSKQDTYRHIKLAYDNDGYALTDFCDEREVEQFE